MRVTGGRARGISLRVPPGDRVRPATDQGRQAVFNSLGETPVGAKVLDLFAGVGSYGLEALSRGAESVTFVEKDRKALEALRQNVTAVEKSLGKTGAAKIVSGDVLRFRTDERFEVIFADPPYVLLEKVAGDLQTIVSELLSESGTFVLEGPPVAVARFEIVRELGKADAPIRILRRA